MWERWVTIITPRSDGDTRSFCSPITKDKWIRLTLLHDVCRAGLSVRMSPGQDSNTSLRDVNANRERRRLIGAPWDSVLILLPGTNPLSSPSIDLLHRSVSWSETYLTFVLFCWVSLSRWFNLVTSRRVLTWYLNAWRSWKYIYIYSTWY